MGLGLQNPLHILLIVVVVLLIFGAKRLPEIGRSLGQGIRELKGSLAGDEDDARELPADAAAPQPSAEHREATPAAGAQPQAAAANGPPAGEPATRSSRAGSSSG